MILRPVIRPILRPTLRPVFGRSSMPLFDLVREDLFGNGEQGIYMPSVHESFLRGDLFQDAAGTTPVTAAGQPVGLWLDRSKGLVLGAELVTNGDFSDGSTGWTVEEGWSFLGDKAVFAEADDTIRAINQPLPSGNLTGKYVEVVFDLEVLTGSLSLSVGGYVTDEYTEGGRKQVKRFAHQLLANNRVYFTARAGFTGSVTNISVRELPGNHASQSSTSLRPAYRTAPERLDFDGVDDKLTATFASSLGSDCTVGLSVPGSGASILTGQTVGTSYDITADTCGIVIVDRALTAGETDRLTQLLNQAAGV